jgi:hypothetical protein
VVDDVFVDSETFLVTHFINFQIKPTQSFKNIYKEKIYIHMFIKVYTHIYIYKSLYICTVFFKRKVSFSHCTGALAEPC